MGHGGAREGAGQPPKFPGRPDTKNKRVPRDIPNRLVDEWINRVITLKDAGIPVDGLSVDEINRAYHDLTH